jgi:predicted ATP-grasp superfamily ATP-dependent carboligase
MPSALPPVLLTVGRYYGTLAAARCLGRAGIPVTLAEPHRLAPARWSRFVTRRVGCPEVLDADAFLAWLLAFGAASPGHVLLPCSDDVAWLVAENHRALGANFRLLPSSFAAMDALLDKRSLGEHCQAVGLDIPETWFPQSEEEAAAIGAREGFPLLVKPRTQVLLETHAKGALVEDPSEIRPRFREFEASERYGRRMLRLHPDVRWPMLQRYHAGARETIYGLSGYVDGRGEVVAVRAARKIFQRPRKLGVGLCFEEAAVEAELVRGIGALCRRVGYQGVFEVEFVNAGSRRLLIDFNPRFYGQLAFDVERGMPLPRFAYADALGDHAALAALADEAHRAEENGAPGARAYCHHFLFDLILRAQQIAGHGIGGEEERWRRWWEAHRDSAVDPVADPDDPAPWRADVAGHLAGFARHPRSSFRTLWPSRDERPSSASIACDRS